jgi:hypothetical protein
MDGIINMSALPVKEIKDYTMKTATSIIPESGNKEYVLGLIVLIVLVILVILLIIGVICATLHHCPKVTE